jgi:hypothetical protein
MPGLIGPGKLRRMLEALPMLLNLPADDADLRAGEILCGPKQPPDEAAYRAAWPDAEREQRTQGSPGSL